MTKKSKWELLDAVRPRYQKAGRKEKGMILEQFVAATGYHRKYAIWLLKHGAPEGKKQRRERGRVYGRDVVAPLVMVWEASGRVCGKRLQPFVKELVEILERHGELRLSGEQRRLLCRMSASTIDRALKQERARYPRRGRSTTRPGSLVKATIPIRQVGDWSEQHPGFMEVDLVAHCGASPAGDFLYTLTMIDIYTRWTHLDILPGKQQLTVRKAIHAARRRLPFHLLGIDSDSGGEFINHLLLDYCRDEGIVFTRSRPYHKNDQAHVEQKNWSVVRQWVGYARYESQAALACLRLIYADLCLLVNFFQPTMKLTAKIRVGSKVRKRYARARTPYQYLLASRRVTRAARQRLGELYQSLNPLDLQRRIDANLRILCSLAR